MDLFVTGAMLAGAAVPTDRAIDGIDLAPVLFQDQPLPERPFFYYRGDELAACRLGRFKLHFSTQDGFSSLAPEPHDPPLLFDLGGTPGSAWTLPPHTRMWSPASRPLFLPTRQR